MYRGGGSKHFRVRSRCFTAHHSCGKNLVLRPESAFEPGTQELIDTMRELTRQLGQLATLIRSSQ